MDHILWLSPNLERTDESNEAMTQLTNDLVTTPRIETFQRLLELVCGKSATLTNKGLYLVLDCRNIPEATEVSFLKFATGNLQRTFQPKLLRIILISTERDLNDDGIPTIEVRPLGLDKSLKLLSVNIPSSIKQQYTVFQISPQRFSKICQAKLSLKKQQHFQNVFGGGHPQQICSAAKNNIEDLRELAKLLQMNNI